METLKRRGRAGASAGACVLILAGVAQPQSHVQSPSSLPATLACTRVLEAPFV